MIEVRLSHGVPVSVAVRTDTGRVRSNNEDAHRVEWMSDGSLLVIVADGMGGHEAGEVASRLAVDTIARELVEQPVPDPRHRLYNAFLSANRAILDEAQRGGKRGMGTTTVVTVVRGSDAFVGQVGDSRVIHVRRGHLMWRTLDHTRVQSLVDRGLIREEEARTHSDAGMLTRALGHARMSNGDPLEPEVQRQPLALREGDAVVLCTDGCHDALEDWEIAMAVAGSTAEEACERLVGMALDRGGHDNVTVAVVVVGNRAAPYDPSMASMASTSGREGEHTDAVELPEAPGAAPRAL
ncbi:MAG TPA: protein phosphatase 2C domain-containing protein, partial [Myxococcota bacterium]|nr:protein phosphatase 2C domain-containing protein [Myxococcota bacterium]